MARLLVIDDEHNLLYSLEKALHSDTLNVITALTGKQGIELVQQQAPDVVILDVRLSDMSGLDVFDRIRRIDPRLPVIIITAYATTETAIEATKRGAFEYLLKPVDFHQLSELVSKAIDLSRQRHVPAVFGESHFPDDHPVDRIVGQCPAMQEVYKSIGRVAPQDVPVLILGESGTGKELVARALYQHSRRSEAPFLTINCAAIPEGLLESELFGHERGAFTGAERRRIGKFEQAKGGTIFLDEIGDMTAATQPKILRLLQEQQFERLGSNDTIQTDVRVIAATNQNLEYLVAAGRLRQDLYYRLKVFTIHLPPLRERRDDIRLLVEHFIKLFGPTLGKRVVSVSPDTLRSLECYDWPGNIRELQSVIQVALVRAPGEVLTLDCLPEAIAQEAPAARIPQAEAEGALNLSRLISNLLQAGEPEIYRRVSMAVDRIVIDIILRHTKGNQVQASELLGVSRTTLRAKLRSLGLAVEKQLLSDVET